MHKINEMSLQTLLLNQLRTEIGSGTTKARVFPIEKSKEAFDYITDPSNDESKSIYDGSSHDLRSMLNVCCEVEYHHDIFISVCSSIQQDLLLEL